MRTATVRVELSRLAACILVAALSVCAASPAVSAEEVEYPDVVPGRPLSFPLDEGAHPAFRTEWWYITGWLTGSAEDEPQNDPLGFQITFFRARPGADESNPSRFAARQLLFAHVALSDPRRGALVRGERSARAGFGLAEARSGFVDIHIDDWSLRQDGDHYDVSIVARNLTIELEFVRTQPPLLHGDGGFSRKGPDPLSASYYYSLPQLATHGRVVVDGRERRVEGASWFDHEWSTAYMDDGASGWDWVGLNLSGGGALMAFRMRNEAGGEHWAAATFRPMPPSGQSSRETYAADEVEWTPLRYWRSARTGVRYPIEWRVSVGGRAITLKPLMDDQENDARGSTGTLYWEGAVRAFDDRGRQIGQGYLELTGYGSQIRF